MPIWNYIGRYMGLHAYAPMPVGCRPRGRRVHRRVVLCGAVCTMRRVQGAVCTAVRRRVAPCGAV